MKLLSVGLAVILMVALALPAFSTDIQAGSYVKVGEVALFGYDPSIAHDRVASWDFVGAAGTCTPFEITAGNSRWPQRTVSVPENVFGVLPGTDAWLLGEPSIPVTWTVSEVVFHWESNYQASQMRLELYKKNPVTGYTLLWAQNRSDYYWGYSNVLGQWQTVPVGDQVAFRVTTVPEAGGALSMLAGLGALVGFGRKLRWRYFVLSTCCCIGLAAISGMPAQALTPSDVLVVYNEEPSIANASEGVARYYAQERGIPPDNVLGIETSAGTWAPVADYVSDIATPISNYLSTRPNVKVIVSCYGVPYQVLNEFHTFYYSVDSALMLLGNPGVLQNPLLLAPRSLVSALIRVRTQDDITPL